MDGYLNSVTATDVMEIDDINNQDHTDDDENSMNEPKVRGKN